MSFSRRTDDTTTITKGLEYSNESISPKSPVKHQSKEVLSGTRREKSEPHQQRHGRTTKKTYGAKGVGDDGTFTTKRSLSELTRTEDSVGLNDKKEKVGDEIHGVLRLPENVRTVSASKKTPTIVQGANYTMNIENDSTLIHEISTCETNLNNLVTRWSGDVVKFQHIIAVW